MRRFQHKLIGRIGSNTLRGINKGNAEMTAKSKINKGKEKAKYTVLTMDPETKSMSLN